MIDIKKTETVKRPEVEQPNSDSTNVPNSKGLGIASLAFGVLSIFVSGFFGIVAIIFGIIAIKRKSGKGLAIVGIIIGLIGILLFIMMTVALPVLQRSQRDTARKNNASLVMTAITTYSSNNKGVLPQDSDITNGSFASKYLTNLDNTEYSIGVSSEQPSESKMIFTRGVNCSDAGSVTGDRQYNIQVKLESGDIYCIGS